MKKFLLIAISTVFMICANAQSTTKNFDVSDFDAISVSGAMNVTVTRGSTHSVSVTANQGMMEGVRVSVSQRKLALSFSTSRLTARQKRQFNGRTVMVSITMPALNGVEMSGATRLNTVGDFSARSFTCKLSGASSISGLSMTASSASIDLSGASSAKISGDLGELTVRLAGASQANINSTATSVKASAGGGSRINLAGRAGQIEASAAGASRIDAGSFVASTGSVSATGASSVVVNVSDNLRVSVTGASSVSYRGNPRIDISEVSKSATLRREQ